MMKVLKWAGELMLFKGCRPWGVWDGCLSRLFFGPLTNVSGYFGPQDCLVTVFTIYQVAAILP